MDLLSLEDESQRKQGLELLRVTLSQQEALAGMSHPDTVLASTNLGSDAGHNGATCRGRDPLPEAPGLARESFWEGKYYMAIGDE